MREIIVKEWRDDKGLIHRREVGQELVRCKECKNYLNGHLCTHWNDFGTVETSADDFCSYGEVYEDIPMEYFENGGI